MEDAVGVIEGDATAEESYLNQAKEGVEKGNLTPDSATEIMNGGTAVMEQAQEKKETVDSIYNTVTSEKKIAGKELTKTQIKELLTKGKTKKITGFTSSKGKSFDASLELADKKINFKFD